MIDGIMYIKTTTQGSGAGGNTSLTLTVPNGEVWKVLMALAYHDDAARNCYWQVGDGTNTVIVGAQRSAASDIPVYLYEGYNATGEHPGAWQAPLVLRATQALVFQVAAMAAGKTITGIVLIERLRGAEPVSMV